MNPQKIALLTDSCADLPPGAVEEYGNIFVLPLRILCADGEYADGVNIRGADIYRRLKAGELPQTSLPAGEQEELMETFLLETATNNPKELAHHLLGRVLERSGELPTDDMTILAVGIWKR